MNKKNLKSFLETLDLPVKCKFLLELYLAVEEWFQGLILRYAGICQVLIFGCGSTADAGFNIYVYSSVLPEPAPQWLFVGGQRSEPYSSIHLWIDIYTVFLHLSVMLSFVQKAAELNTINTHSCMFHPPSQSVFNTTFSKLRVEQKWI